MSTNIYHNHHIVPRHAGGTDDPSNLIRLTIEEHAEAHRILWETHGRIQDKLAWIMLSGKTTESESVFRELYRQAAANHRGWHHTEETKAKISAANTGNSRPDLSKWNTQNLKGARRGPQSTEHTKRKANALREFYNTPAGIESKRRASERMRSNNPMHKKSG